MMHNLFLFIYRQPLGRVLLWALLLIAIWGYLGYRENGRLRWKLANGLVFAVTVAVIFYMTVHTRGETAGEAILIPFQSFRNARIQPELYRSMLMNVFLFVPVGMSLPFVIGKGRGAVLITVLVALVFSGSIEYLQYRYALGWCEMDDIIMNTLGAATGGLAYVLSRNWEKRVAPKLDFLKDTLRRMWNKIKIS